ncbi:MAG: hypothetical protein L0H75_08555 [Nitrosospira sp.]|nr:hypothetical protein [Nitrosospira sp.]
MVELLQLVAISRVAGAVSGDLLQPHAMAEQPAAQWVGQRTNMVYDPSQLSRGVDGIQGSDEAGHLAVILGRLVDDTRHSGRHSRVFRHMALAVAPVGRTGDAPETPDRRVAKFGSMAEFADRGRRPSALPIADPVRKAEVYRDRAVIKTGCTESPLSPCAAGKTEPGLAMPRRARLAPLVADPTRKIGLTDAIALRSERTHVIAAGDEGAVEQTE